MQEGKSTITKQNFISFRTNPVKDYKSRGKCSSYQNTHEQLSVRQSRP